MTLQELFQIQTLHGFILQIFFAECLFIPLLKRRKHFVLRAVGGLLLYFLIAWISVNVVMHYVSGITSFIVFLLSIGLFYFCFDEKIKTILFCCVGAQLIQNLSHNLENLIYLPFAENYNDVGHFFLSVGIMIGVYVGAYFIIVRLVMKREEINIGNAGVFAMAIVAASFCFLMQFLFQLYKIDRIWVTRLPLLLCCVLALFLQFGILTYKKKEEENLLLESYMAQGNTLYETLKTSVDIINMKAHDLKHFVGTVQSGADEGVDEISTALEQYEQTANTGNKALDVILTQQMYLCHKYKISFTFMADGAQLSFLHASDIASLFGNAISNAIEYERKVEEANRSIFLKVFRKGNLVCIHVENYCTAELVFEGDLPVTTKSDEEYHGFGLKSIRYIAERYKGNVVVSRSGDLFTLDIVIPVSREKSGA